MVLFIEVVVIAVGVNTLGSVAGAVSEALFSALGSVFVVLLIGCLIATLFIAENGFGAAHAHALVVSQLAMLTMYAGMIVGSFGYDSLGWGVGAFLFTTVGGGILFWVWAYILSFMLAGKITDPDTKPAFYEQLGITPGGGNDTDVSSAYIREILYSREALILAAATYLVSLVFSAVSARRRMRH